MPPRLTLLCTVLPAPRAAAGTHVAACPIPTITGRGSAAPGCVSRLEPFVVKLKSRSN